MREADKGWKYSTKLHIAAVAGIIIIGIYLDNRHNPLIADHVISCAELGLTVALGGSIGMQVTQSIINRASEEIGNFKYTPAPKDVDDGTVP